MTLTKGVSSRLTTLGAAAEFTDHPDLNCVSIMLKWKLHAPNVDGGGVPVYSSLVEAQLIAAIETAHARGKGLILRLMGGVDAPAWVYTHPSTPVTGFYTLDNDSTPALYGSEIRIPNLTASTSRTRYLAHQATWFARVNTLLTANDSSGHPRYNHVVCVTVPANEDGAEMSNGYGSAGDTIYSGAATLGASMGSGTTLPQTITLSGSYGAYPSGDAILQVGSELVHQRSRSGATVTVGKRGHSGTSAAAHSSGAVIKYGSSKVTLTDYQGYPATGTASYDHRAVNRAAWAALGSEATNRTALQTYFQTAATDMASALNANIGVSLAGGQLFSDNLVAADAIIDAIGPTLGARMFALTTNLSDGYAYPTTHPHEHDWLLRAISHGCYVMCQTEGTTRLPQPPAAGALQEFIASCEFALETYGVGTMVILETGQVRFDNTATDATVAVGGWDGGTSDSQESYLLTATE